MISSTFTGQMCIRDRTKGTFHVSQIHPVDMSEDTLLELAAYAEAYSNHPISLSIQKAYQKEIQQNRVEDIEEVSGHGVKAKVDGHLILAGNAKLMEQENIPYQPNRSPGTVVYVARDGVYAGFLLIEDEIKEDAERAIQSLRAAHVRKMVMLTGDADAVGQKVAKQIGLDEAYTELLPAGKVEKMEAVSYTHLDVYKRQPLAYSGQKRITEAYLISGPLHFSGDS